MARAVLRVRRSVLWDSLYLLLLLMLVFVHGPGILYVASASPRLIFLLSLELGRVMLSASMGTTTVSLPLTLDLGGHVLYAKRSAEWGRSW